jgi:hypothetical protein
MNRYKTLDFQILVSIRIHSGTLPGGVHGKRFEVERTRYYESYNAQSPGRTFCVHENTYARGMHVTR